jgi:hypothetical protein
MAARVEPSNFYWHNSPVANVAEVLPRGQKITTLLPANIVHIRIAVTAVFTAYVVARIMGLTVWAWPVVILGATFSVYTAVKHLFRQDPLVNAMYQIAGGEQAYNALPEYPKVNVNVPLAGPNLAQVKREHPEWLSCPDATFTQIRLHKWENLDRPLYRATTPDGRKVLIVRGRDRAEEVNTYTMTAFVEKAGPKDTMSSWINTAFLAIPITNDLENWFSDYAFAQNGREVHKWMLRSSISSDMVNEFIQQRSDLSK